MTIKIVMIDMDGVLVDLHNGFCEKFGLDDPYLDPNVLGKYDYIAAHNLNPEEVYPQMDYEFWINLKPTEEFDSLINLLFNSTAECIVVSKPLRTHGSMEGKRDWLKKYLPALAKNYVFTPCRWLLANKATLLIDDDVENVNKFRVNDGKAILVPRPWNHLHHVKNVISYVRNQFETWFNK